MIGARARGAFAARHNNVRKSDCIPDLDRTLSFVLFHLTRSCETSLFRRCRGMRLHHNSASESLANRQENTGHGRKYRCCVCVLFFSDVERDALACAYSITTQADGERAVWTFFAVRICCTLLPRKALMIPSRYHSTITSLVSSTPTLLAMQHLVPCNSFCFRSSLSWQLS